MNFIVGNYKVFYVLIVFISIFSSSKVTGQETDGYKYNYRFQLDNLADTNSVTIELLQKRQDTFGVIIGKVIDKRMNLRSFTPITLRDRDTVINIIADSNGQFQINAKPSIYELTISDIGYTPVTKTLIIDGKTDYNLTIRLASEILPTWYNIYSKRKLTKGKIEEIKKCVKANENSLINCGKENEYYISFEI